MLLVYTGSDYASSAKLAGNMINSLQEKQHAAELVELQTNNLEYNLQTLTNDQGLFFSKSLVKITRLFPDKEAEKIMRNQLSNLSQSQSIFVWVEPNLNKNWLRWLEDAGAKIEVSGQSQKSTGNKPLAFEVSDALLTTKAIMIWQSLKKARKNNLEGENIFGVLWWQLRSVVLAQSYDSPKSAGLSPYVYRKSRGCSWSAEQARTIMMSLLTAQQSSRQNNLNLWVELENWALGLDSDKGK
jgi:hypothetical protein